MHVWKKIIIGVIIIVVLFGTGFFTGYRTGHKIGDGNNSTRITELEDLNTELGLGINSLRKNYKQSESRLTEFLKREKDRNDRALQILGGAGDKTSEVGSSIDRAISAADRLSEAIEILLSNE